MSWSQSWSCSHVTWQVLLALLPRSFGSTPAKQDHLPCTHVSPPVFLNMHPVYDSVQVEQEHQPLVCMDPLEFVVAQGSQRL